MDRLAALDREGALLVAAAARVDHAATVPGCPDWQVADLLRHVGLVHRWAEQVVRTADPDGTSYPADDGCDLSGAGLLDWVRAGHAALVGTLAAADPAVRAFTFLPAASPLEFWIRRQLHETGVHRADVESAGGPVTPYPVDEAVDGIGEMLGGFAARRSRKVDALPPRTLGVLPSDTAAGWLVRLGAPPVPDPAAAAGADCVLRGTASDLHLLLWNRPAGPVTTQGDPGVLEDWRRTIRVRWGGSGPRAGRPADG
jgi:uncharacterized protein (TIGR03083 family)